MPQMASETIIKKKNLEQFIAYCGQVIYYLFKREKEESSETMRRTIIKVQRIAVKIIAVLCTAPLLIQSLLPLWLELPNQLPQHIWSIETIQWCSSFATQKCESRPSTRNSLPQLPELHPPEATHGWYFHFSSKFPPISMRACIATTRGSEAPRVLYYRENIKITLPTCNCQLLLASIASYMSPFH